jgi:hypothetical protein
MGTKRKSQKKEKKRKKIKQKLFAKLPTERQNHCRRELGGFGGVDTFRVATKEAHLLFLFGLFVCLFVFVLLREEAWRRTTTTTTTTTRRRAFEVASLQRKEFQQSFFVFP